MIGDSIIQALGLWNSTTQYNTLSSPVDWGNFLAGSRCYIPPYGNKGTGSESSGQVASRFTIDLAPLAPKIIVFNGGVNRIHLDPAETIIAEINSCIAQGIALGARLIYVPILQHSEMSAGDITKMNTVNAAMRAQQTPTFRVIDAAGYDYTIHTYAELGSGDRVHPNIIGAQLLGAEIAEILEAWVQPGSPLLEPADGANRFPYGAMAGTGGSPDGGASGVIASNWAVWGDGAGGATVVASKVSDPDGDWQRVTVSGNYSGDTRTVILTSGYALSGGAAEENFETCLELRVSGAQNVDSVGVLSYLYDSGFGDPVFASWMQNNTANDSGGYDAPDYQGVVRVMPTFKPGETPANGRVFITAFLRENGSSTPCAVTFDVRKVSLKELAAGVPWQMAAPSLTPGDEQIEVNHAAAPYANGTAITSYDLRYSTDETNWTEVLGISDPDDITGLTNDTEYFVQTRAVNAAGNGPWSESASATPSVSVLYETDFSSSSGWTLQTNVTISGGTLNFTATGAGFRTASRSPGLVNGTQYRVTFDLVISSGNFRVVVGGTPGGNETTSGAKEHILTAGANPLLELQCPDAGSTCSIDNLRVEAM